MHLVLVSAANLALHHLPFILAQAGGAPAPAGSDAEQAASTFELGHMWSNMGWVARGVALTLAIMSVISICLFIERLVVFGKANKQSIRFAELVSDHLQGGRLKEANAAAESEEFSASHVARVCSAGIREFLSGRPGATADVVESARKAIDRAIQTETL